MVGGGYEGKEGGRSVKRVKAAKGGYRALESLYLWGGSHGTEKRKGGAWGLCEGGEGKKTDRGPLNGGGVLCGAAFGAGRKRRRIALANTQRKTTKRRQRPNAEKKKGKKEKKN